MLSIEIMKKIVRISCIGIFMVFLSFGALGQDLQNFQRLKSEGEIPSYFVKYLNEKIASDREAMEEDKRISKQSARDFSAITNYKMQQLIRGGRVLYGDPLTKYAEKVLDKLKASSDEDLSDVQIFTLKSNEVNAFATAQRVIFITVGLWGQIRNEAELAFILAHECTHLIKKHNQLQYEKTKNTLKSGSFGEGAISRYFQYSKQHEMESDHIGMEWAAKAGYDVKEMNKVYEVLMYAYLPIDELPIDYAWFENEGFKIPAQWKKKEVKAIAAVEDIADEYSTHPNILSRKENVEDIVDEYEKKGGKIYQVEDEKKFKYIQNLARFEMLNIFLRNSNYVSSLYHGLILSHQFPDNKFINRTIAMSWYGISASTSKDVRLNYEDVKLDDPEGEISRLNYMVDKMTPKEAQEFVVKQIWELSFKSDKDTFVRTLREKALDFCLSNGYGKLEDFATTYDTLKTEEKDTAQSKYEKISKKRKKKEGDNKYFWLSIVNHEEFQSYYKKSEAVYKKKKLEKYENDDDEENEEEWKEEEVEPQEIDLAIERVAMIMPSYFRHYSRKNVKKNITNSNMSEVGIIEMLHTNSKQLGLELQYVNNFVEPGYNTEKYNNFSLLFDYLGERALAPIQEMIPYNGQYSQQLKEAYNTNYISYFDIQTEIQNREFNSFAFWVSLFTVYGFPVYLVWQFTPETATEYNFLVYDIENHEPVFASQKYFNNKLNKQMQNAHFYHSLNQITRKK